MSGASLLFFRGVLRSNKVCRQAIFLLAYQFAGDLLSYYVPLDGELVVTHVIVFRQGYHVEASILVVFVTGTKSVPQSSKVPFSINNLCQTEVNLRVLPPLDEIPLLLK